MLNKSCWGKRLIKLLKMAVHLVDGPPSRPDALQDGPPLLLYTLQTSQALPSVAYFFSRSRYLNSYSIFRSSINEGSRWCSYGYGCCTYLDSISYKEVWSSRVHWEKVQQGKLSSQHDYTGDIGNVVEYLVGWFTYSRIPRNPNRLMETEQSYITIYSSLIPDTRW